LLSAIDALNADGLMNLEFQQYNAKLHTSPGTIRWLEDEARKHGFSIMHWPVNSPDQNPMEHLCAHLKG
jgi:hypothetical protein